MDEFLIVAKKEGQETRQWTRSSLEPSKYLAKQAVNQLGYDSAMVFNIFGVIRSDSLYTVLNQKKKKLSCTCDQSEGKYSDDCPVAIPGDQHEKNPIVGREPCEKCGKVYTAYQYMVRCNNPNCGKCRAIPILYSEKYKIPGFSANTEIFTWWIHICQVNVKKKKGKFSKVYCSSTYAQENWNHSLAAMNTEYIEPKD